MKTVSGRVTSSKPVSLSKAARSLAKFASSDNGASPAFAAYLRRASASFDELVQLHKELKGSGADSKGKQRHTDETVNSVKKRSENSLISEENHGVSDRTKQSSEGNVSRNVVGDLDAMGVNGVKKEIENRDGDKETTKKKKKHKGEREESDGAVKIEKPEQSCPRSQNDANGEATDVVENGSSERKRHKSKKGKNHEKESSGMKDPNDGGDDKKESRKRKHKGSDN